MRILLGPLSLLALAFAATGAVAFDGKLTATFTAVSDQGPTTLSYYDSACAPSGAAECVVTYLWCDSPRDIGFEVRGVADTVLGKWLVKDGARATLTSHNMCSTCARQR